jgi:vacuolar-type H+-ATPase subunit I/STV1
MLHAVPMMHLRVLVPNRDAAAVTRCVARQGLLHLIDLAHGRAQGGPQAFDVSELLAGYRDLAVRIRSLAGRLGADLPGPLGALASTSETDFAQERERLEAELRPLETQIDASWRSLVAARERRATLAQAESRAALVRAAGVDPARVRPGRFLALRLARGSEEEATTVAQLLSPGSFAVLPLAHAGEEWTFAVAGPAGMAERIDSALRAAGCEAVAPTDPPDPAELERAAEAEQHARAELDAHKERAVPVLGKLLARAETGVLLLEAQALFASSGRFTVLSGWVPAHAAEQLRAALREATGGRAIIDLDRPEDLPEAASGALRVPILHRNPVLLRPFQNLVRLYGTPSYEEIEPTAFFAVSFLLMFGMMFGDVGHGLVLFAAGFCLFRFVTRFLDYGILMMEAGAASMVFGVLYGSIFGFENLLPALWLRPIHDLPRFMAVAVTLGGVLVSLGLILNVINQWRAGKRTGALFGPHGLFGAFLYWVLMVLLVRWFLPHTHAVAMWAVGALCAAAAALLLLRPVLVRKLPRREPRGPSPSWISALESGIELVDTLFSFFTNTVSFVRIAAFAAVHAGISVALFAIVDSLAALRFGGALSILALVLGNAAVILLEGLTVSVQVLRLEYYEFFTKFFHGGGEPFRPLMLRGAEKGGAS